MTDDPIREELNQLVVAHRLTEIMKPFHPVDMVPAAVALDLLRQLRERDADITTIATLVAKAGYSLGRQSDGTWVLSKGPFNAYPAPPNKEDEHA